MITQKNSQQTNQTFQKGRGDNLNGNSKRSGEILKVKTADNIAFGGENGKRI
jgi:hypothetical protein